MKNMALNNPYVQKDLSDGMFFKQMKQYQQQHQQSYDNDQEERHANGSDETPMDDGGFHDEITCGGADGKHEENDAADYIYEDLGPETDVDAVDDANNTDNVDDVIENPLLDNAANFSHGISQGDINMLKNENNFQEDNTDLKVTLETTTLDDEDSPANNDIKALQHALLPEADNVADSEDSEDEWNYYRVGPNKEKDTAATSEELREIKNDNEIKNVEHLDEDNNVEELSRSPTSERNNSRSRSRSRSSSSSSECESQKGEELLPELSNTDIGIEEKRIDSAFLNEIEKKEVEEEEEEKERNEGSDEDKEYKREEEEEEEEEEYNKREEEEEDYNKREEEKDEEEEKNMDSQLNPNAAEFVPVSSPKRTIKISAINDSFVAGSPMKTAIMDDIVVPSQQEFDEEISARPHEIDEKDSSSNGNHAAHSDYDFYTEQQKIMNPTIAATTTTTIATAAAGLDESEISSTKAEYGDDTINFLCTTGTDLHKTDISTMEDSFGDTDCDIYNRDNPMTISYTPGDFKAAFNKEVDLNAVHDLSDDEDIEDENYSSEIKTFSQSPKTTDLARRFEFDILSNGDSSNEMQTSSLLSKDDNAFLKFQDSVEQKNTEFIQVELEHHPSSSPIDSSFDHDFSKEQDNKSFNLLENKEEMMDIGRREEEEEEEKKEKEEEKEKETERVETHKEAEYVDDEKDIAADDDIIPSKDNSEFIVDKPVEIATDLIQSEIFKDTTISQDQYNFLSSTIDESSKLNPMYMSSIETAELVETSAEPLKNGLISSMENLKLTTGEEDRPIMVFNLCSEAPEFQSSESSVDPFFTGEPALSDIASKQSLLEDSPTQQQQPDLTENHQKESSSFLPTFASETVSENERPTENLLKLNETTTQVPTIDHIEESKSDEYTKSCLFEDISEKPSQHMDESVCPINTDDKQIYMEWESSPENKSTDNMKVDDTFALHLSESDDSKDLIMQQPDSTESHQKESSSFLPTFASETVSENDRPTENLSKLNEITTEVPIIDNIEENKTDEYPQSYSFEDITEKKSTDKMEVDVNTFEKVEDTVALNLSESIQEFTGLEKQLEPENFTPEESPMAEFTPSIEDKIMNENIVEHKESVIQEAVEGNLHLDTKEEEEEEALEAKEDAEIVQVTESTELKPTELVTPIEDIVIEKASDAFDLEKPVSMPTDTETTVLSTGIEESKESAKNIEITKSLDTTTTMGVIETAEIAEPANIAKTVDITEAVPATIVKDVEEQKVVEPLKVEEPVKVEEEKMKSVLTTSAGTAAIPATNTSSNKTKVKPTTTRSTKPVSSSTKAVPPKSTPTSPSKNVTLTAKSSSSTTATATTKKPIGSVAARPKHLDTAPTKSLTSTNAAKSTTTTKMASKTSATTTSSTTKAATRPSSAQTKSKLLPSSARSTTTTSTIEKKSAPSSDAKPLSKTTTKAAATTKSTSTSASAKTSASKTTTGSRTSTNAITSTTTTTAASATGKSRPTSAITAAKSPAKSAGTNATSGGGLSNATKSKTTSTSNTTTKTSRTLAKSPMIDKQIKETANKQISMSRTTSSPVTKTTRSSMSATTTLNSNTTKRMSSQKVTSTTTSTSAHSPIKKVTSKVSSGQSSGATKSSSTTKVKVMQNGTANNAEITKTTTTTTTTTIITADSKNEDDVPKKDLSPVVAHTDNQLISSAD